MPRPLVGALIAAAVTAAGIAAIAITGGFDAAVETGPSEHGLGDPFVSSHLEMTVERVAVLDELGFTGTYPDEDAGERLLAVLLEVTSLDAEPRGAAGVGSITSIRLANRPDDAPSIVVRGDTDFSSVTLQPDVPTRIILTWIVSADEVSAGDDVRLQIPDAEKNDSTLFRGESIWFELDSRVVVTAEAEDLGAGNPDGRL